MTGRSPQVLVTLSADDKLVIELAKGAIRHQVVLRGGDAEATLLRILRAQRESRVEIGLDGAPTQAQVTHWERHQQWPDQRCRFCLAEGRIKPARAARVAKRVRVDKKSDGVEIRRIASGVSGVSAMRTHCSKSLEELGL